MPESFDTLLAEIAETAGFAVHPAGPAVARHRGHQRAVRHRAAVSVLSVMLLGAISGLALGLAGDHSGAPAPITHSGTPTPSPTASPSASPSPNGSSWSPGASAPPSAAAGDLNTIVPGAWTSASQFALSWLDWAPNMSRPAIHTADRQWFYSCLGSGTLAHLGASGYQEVSYTPTLPGTQSTDSADQVLFFFPTTNVAAQALAIVQNDYAHCPEQTTGTNGAAITGSVHQTEELDGGYAWLHSYKTTTGAVAQPADIPVNNHEFFVQRGKVVEMVWFGGTDTAILDPGTDLVFLNSLNASLCVYGGACPATDHPITTAITATGSTALTLGGNPVEVEVTVTNNSDDTLRNIAPDVSIERCTCLNTPEQAMPNGVLQLWDASANAWKNLFYNVDGAGTQYVSGPGADQVPGFDLAAGQSVSFKYRLQLNPASGQPKLSAPYRLTNGTSSLGVTLIHPGSGGFGNSVIATSPVVTSSTATQPVTVSVN